MTFSVLRTLHGIIGEALDDIEAVYAPYRPRDKPPGESEVPGLSGHSLHGGSAEHSNICPAVSISTPSAAYASPPPSPCTKTETAESLPRPSFDFPSFDFPSLDAPYDPSSAAEALTQHPDVVRAINRIVAACGQMTATIQAPFLTLCDAIMAYHLPSCMRLFEASHIPEILREAGPAGLHVDLISERNGVDKTKLAHILRLLATHHIVRELSPDVFTLNRISSMVDTGKSFQDLQQWTTEGVPEKKYENTSGIAAFVGLCSDEVYKSSAYLTETYLLSQSKNTGAGSEPTRAPFCFAFGTVESGTGFFGWLEGSADPNPANCLERTEDIRIETDQGTLYAPIKDEKRRTNSAKPTSRGISLARYGPNPNHFRLERFGKAMAGTCSWETPGAILSGFDWHSLPRNSVVVDVGGGIGSTSMLLANAFSSADGNSLGLRFIIQDRPTVVEMGEKVWKAKCPGLLENGTALFQAHDFFTPQPVKQAAVFLLRVVLHDWPDDFARRILLHLREAAMPDTKLLLGDFILPLACPDGIYGDELLEGIQGAESTLASPPLLPNLGKASANAYWMDLTMQVMFNAQERTLREIVVLTASAGWKIVRVTKCAGSLFGYIVAVPTSVPDQSRCQFTDSVPYRGPVFTDCKSQAQSSTRIAALPSKDASQHHGKHEKRELIERSSPRCDASAFGSRTRLPLVEETLSKFGGGTIRSRKPETATGLPLVPPRATSLKKSITLTRVPPVKKKAYPRPVSPHATSPSPPATTADGSSAPRPPFQALGRKVIPKRLSLANIRAPSGNGPAVSLLDVRAPPSPMSPLQSLKPRKSLVHLSTLHGQKRNQPAPTGLDPSDVIPTQRSPRPCSPAPRQGGVKSGIPLPISPSTTPSRRRGSEEQEPQSQLPVRNISWRSTQPSQDDAMARRLSSAQLQPPALSQKLAPSPPLQATADAGLRKRTKSVAGIFSRASQQAASAVKFAREAGLSENGMHSSIDAGSSRLGSLLGRRGGGTNLRFEKSEAAVVGGFPEFSSGVNVNPAAPAAECDHDREEQDDTDSEYGPINVLAAAARIEKRVLRRRGAP